MEMVVKGLLLEQALTVNKLNLRTSLHLPKRRGLPPPHPVALSSSRALRCSSNPVAPSIGPRTPVDIDSSSRLKQELFTAIEAAQGSLDDACLSIVSSLENLSTVPDVTLQPDLLRGCLLLAKANFKENRSDGQKRLLGYRGAGTTLGSTTFNILRPADLQISLFDTYQHVSIEGEDSYNLIIEFCIGGGEDASAPPPLEGLIVNRARYRLQSPNRFEIEFLSCGMKPRHPEQDLEAWAKVFKDCNPGMADDGSVFVDFPKPIQGWSDLLYMDDEVRIQRGNKGGVSVMRVLKEPAVCI